MKKLDLTIVAGSRPELTEITLDGLKNVLLPNQIWGSVWVNLDLTANQREQDRSQTRKIINKYFPESIIFISQEPSFGLSVKRLWQLASKSEKNNISSDRYSFFLHFEDDWRSLRKINLDWVAEQFTTFDNAAQVILRREVKSRRKEFSRWHEKHSDSTGKAGRYPAFSTAPSFIDRKFAGKVSQLLIPELHPEKQLHDGRNPRAEKYCYTLRVIKYIWRFRHDVIEDIGRNWLSQRNLQREIVDGTQTYGHHY